ncbi:MAG: 4'-phosphopantetheinyl transferase [Candidatus Azotimanducaceae bacterium]|jgi:4'-phosphopantetheinyl transferase
MDLHSGEIHLFFASPEEISNIGLLSRYQSLLSDKELRQYSRFHFEQHRHQYLVTRALIRSSLSSFYEVEPAQWCFDVNAYGKPSVASGHGVLPIRFNISHTDGLVMCGIVRDTEIGVDVEDIERITRADIHSLSSYFSPLEVAELKRLPKEKQKHRFFDYWTLKESYIKARGMGLSLSLSQFSFVFEGNRLRDFFVEPELNDDSTNWQFWRFAVRARYRVAVAVKSENRKIKISAYHSVPLESNDSFPLVFFKGGYGRASDSFGAVKR